AMNLVHGLPAMRGTIDGRTAWIEFDCGMSGHLGLSGRYIVLNNDLLLGKHSLSSLSYGLGGQTMEYGTRFTFAALGREFQNVYTTYPANPEVKDVFGTSRIAGSLGAMLMRDLRLTAALQN